MPTAKSGDTVKVGYTGRFEDGTVFDTSEGRDPLRFTIGAGEVIPGFENGVEGMSPGETKTLTIPADQAYGPRCDDLVMVVDRKEIPPDMELAVGDALELRQPDGCTVMAVVSDTNDSTVSLDANHPLAGKDLTFDVKLEGIETA